MTTKTITGNYPHGYSLNNSVFSGLDIASTAKVGGFGIIVASDSPTSMTNNGTVASTDFGSGVYEVQGTLANYGSISSAASGSAGVWLKQGGVVQNGLFFEPGQITGQAYGVDLGGAGGKVTNYGYIGGGNVGVYLYAGSVKNSGSIHGGTDGISSLKAVTIANTGAISGATYRGIYLADGGNVSNGGLITGKIGVQVAQAGVYNTGTIEGTTLGVAIYGATLTNGSSTYKAALIEGGDSGVNGVDIVNFGTLKGGNVVADYDYGAGVSGTLTNGGVTDTTALIEGASGLYEALSDAVAYNYGTIVGTGGVIGANGVVIYGGGSLTNGSKGLHNALIEGYGGVEVKKAHATTVPGTIVNLGTIKSTGGAAGFGISTYGGVVTNGLVALRNALVEGGYGLSATNTVAITNYGSIIGTNSFGVATGGGGSVVNGTAADKSAIIEGVTDGFASFGAVTNVTNFGSIEATGGFSRGVYQYASGAMVTNGGAGDTSALISGSLGILMERPGRVVNSATITGLSGAGVESYGGAITNATAAALIEGATFGIDAVDSSATIKNLGTVRATGGGGDFGLAMLGGGTLTNGSAASAVAVIAGYGGLDLQDGAAATNFGTVTASGATGIGVSVGPGGRLTNGAAGHATGPLIEGFTGVTLAAGAPSTLTNFGTIAGEGGAAVQFNSAADLLVVQSGSTFTGAVNGDGGRILLASGIGSVSPLGGGSLTVSGSMAPTTFTDFGTIEVGAAASFTLTGDETIVPDQPIIDNGALTDAGGLNVTGALSGTGILDLTGGTDTLNAGAVLTVAKLAESGAATVVDLTAPTLTYGGAWTQTAGTLSVAAGDRINFTGVGGSFAGTLTGAGTIAFIGGSDTLAGATLSAASLIIDGPTVTWVGAIDLTSSLTTTTKDMIIAAGGATLSGGGTLLLTNLATNTVVGADAGATLTNDDKIKGSGQLGDGSMTLDNAAGALIEGTASAALTINTGTTTTIVNAGTIQADGAGGVTISSPLDNTGLLIANLGTLTVAGAVTGTGHVDINSGAADFTGVFNENVDFTGGFGMLELAHSQSYSGAITGFSLTGGTSLDLRDIGFLSPGEASFSGTATSGVLTVSDGTHTANITLIGDYLNSIFTVSSDTRGGVFVVDPAKGGGAVAPVPASPLGPGSPAPLAFIAAMAGLGGSVGEAGHAVEAWRAREALVIAPRTVAA